MAANIPFQPSVPNYRLTTTLNNTSFNFDVRWNDRAQAWFFDLIADDESPIVYGVKIVLGAYLGRRSTHSFFTTGALLAFDTSGQDLDPGLDDLGARVQVVYLSAAELRSIL